MNAVGLPARIGYAVTALAAVGTAGFYASIWLLPRVVSDTAGDDDGYGLFRAAVGIALCLGLSAALVGLTMPWTRRRRRSGRGRRIALSFLIVVGLSIGFASQHHYLALDLFFAAWLAYVLAYTYIRHGVLDKPSAHTLEDIRPATTD
jgi:O-antigen/teichoic acid export membrane protein